MSELRLRIFRLLEERQRHTAEFATAAQIANVLGEPVRRVVITIRSSQAMGMVDIPAGLNERDGDLPVMLKPAAYIYLESHLDEEDTRGG